MFSPLIELNEPVSDLIPPEAQDLPFSHAGVQGAHCRVP
jgi:hypothetical protein